MQRLIPLLLVSSVLAACITEPEYPVGRLSFEPALLGTWRAELPAGEATPPGVMILKIQGRHVPTNATHTHASRASDKRASSEPANAYTINLHLEESEEVDGKEEKSVMDLTLNAYLVNVAGRTVLGAQVSNEVLEKAGGVGWVLPVHRFFPIQLEDGALRISGPALVGWVPMAGWLDADPNAKREPGAGLRRDDDLTLLLTSSIDRLIAEYDAAPDADAFDFSDSTSLKRTAE